jgi:putative ABC transport system permease protein
MNDPVDGRPLPRAVRSLAGLALVLARGWWPQVAALAAACAVVATTITGALGVGASLTRGLRDLALDRLGAIDAAVVADEPFTAGLAARLEQALATEPGAGGPARVVPALVLSVAVEATGGGGPRATSRATLLACDDLAALGFPATPAVPGRDAVLVNGPLAAALAARPGDAVVVRVPERSTVPSDTPLGRRTAESRGRRLTVEAVLPEAGLGRFALRPVQVTGPLVVTSLETARAILRRGDVLNTVLAVGPPAADRDGTAAGGEPPGAAAWLATALEPDLADHGLALEAVEAVDGGSPTWRLVSRRLVLPAEVDRAAAAVLAPLGGTPSLVFLANAMATVTDATASPAADPPATTRRAASIPYSTVAGVPGPELPCGDLVDEAGATLPPVPPDGIVIDRWMADDLAAQGTAVVPGSMLEMRLFLPETVDGRVEETTARLRIAGIAEMRGMALARDLVPEVEGITDEASIADWDPPFPFDRSRVRAAAPDDQDDRYWKQYGATPKAFVDLATARRLAGSRFGETTAWHVPRQRGDDGDALRRTLAAELRPAALGIRVEPLRGDALAAARGSTPFGGLFLALSSFLVAAGLLLEWLLFHLLVAARRRDVGVLAAVGWPPGRLAALLVLVGGGAAVIGVALGTLLGPAWTAALVAVLGRSWATQVAGGSGAAFAAGPARFAEIWPGAVAALALSVGAMAWAAWRAGRAAPLALLRQRDEPTGGRRVAPRLAVPLAGLALVAAAASAWFGRTAEWQAAVGLFFGAGMLALVGLLALVRAWLGTAAAGPPLSLARLARRGLAWRPGRAFSVAAIVAVAQFLIVAVSSFAVRPPADPEDRASPTGGWTALVTFGEPTMVDPTDGDARAALGLPAAAEEVLAGCTIARLRTSSGDDAACTNLYAAARPTVLGVGRDFVARGGFRFVAHERPADAAARDAIDANPWRLLETDRPPDGPLPAILDQATAQWALKLGGLGSTFTLADGTGQDVTVRIVGLLDTSILQGTVIVAERDFQRLFPARSGYGMALVDAGGVDAARRGAVGPALAAAWADAGTSVEGAADRLRSLLAVQNTFLAGFQALGTLGLLLGTAGVAAVQLQNVLERRGQLALLRAVGFTTGRVRGLVVIETLLTVGLGLVAGTLAALLAVAPLLAGQAGFARLPLGWIAATCGLSLAAALLAGLAAASRHTIPVRPQAD